MAMTMTAKEIKYNKMMVKRQKAIRLARKSFWTFNQLESPDFFKNSRWHLRLMADVLQALYSGELTKAWYIAKCKEICPPWFLRTQQYAEMVDRLVDGYVYRKLMMNEPPRTGKSRTLVNFTKWALGVNAENRVISCSYNDDMATEFSRFCRDGIMETKNLPYEVIYNDVFPNSVIAEGNASYKKWALEGQFFNYLGAGIGGGITGKGCNISIVDDPVKDAEEALNELRLEKIWTWYSGTFLSRNEEKGIEIINMTRWAAGDICGRILGDEKNPGPEAHEWFILSLIASYEVDGEEYMLTPELLSKHRLDRLRKVTIAEIFWANYYQKPIDIQGRLYKTLKTYTDLPKDAGGRVLFERIIDYTDTADDGDDFLCSIVGGIYDGRIYVTDVYYTKDGMEVTEPKTAEFLNENKVNYALIESNNGGKGFARAVERIGWERFRNRQTVIKWFHQTHNKRVRIIVNSAFIQENVFFPVNWMDRWPEFYTAITTYQKEGKNAHDDAPDALTGLVEMINKKAMFAGSVNVNV